MKRDGWRKRTELKTSGKICWVGHLFAFSNCSDSLFGMVRVVASKKIWLRVPGTYLVSNYVIPVLHIMTFTILWRRRQSAVSCCAVVGSRTREESTGPTYAAGPRIFFRGLFTFVYSVVAFYSQAFRDFEREKRGK